MAHDHTDDVQFDWDGIEDALVPEGSSCGEDEFVDDEEGTLLSDDLTRLDSEIGSEVAPGPGRGACSLRQLDGSWLLHLTPRGPHIPTAIRGPMRIEASSRLRVSGDVYVSRSGPVLDPFPPGALVIRKNWYPAFPQRQYRWYFRSTGVSYRNGFLFSRFVRHLWSTSAQDFVSTDRGWMYLFCRANRVTFPGIPQPTIQMRGAAMVGGQLHNASATKTSPFYRGCSVEVDVMKNRTWPAAAPSCDGSRQFSFSGVYRNTGLDFNAVVNETDVPEDALLTIPELHNLLATHRQPLPTGDAWRLWLLVGSRMDGTLGIMFDTGMPPHREGAVGFYDPRFSNSPVIAPFAQGQQIGDVPLAFLRTMIHEAGHVFNLFHPKADVHGVPRGTTIMNQTGDVIGFATPANPYPCNATLGFNDHNRMSLVHSPDPQVKPGWKAFGYGHGSLSSGLPEPTDVAGLEADTPEAEGLELTLETPADVHSGEIVVATVTLTNTGTHSRMVTTALNLSEGDLKITVRLPAGDRQEVRDVVLACSDRRLIELDPGKSIAGNVQLFYNSHGHTFDQPGRYEISAELDIGDAEGAVARSAAVYVQVRSAVSEPERKLNQLMMDPEVGFSLALGDFGMKPAVQDKLKSVMDDFAETDTGAACAMVVANSLSRDLCDTKRKVVRKASETTANKALEVAVAGREASAVARLATAVVTARETTAPLLKKMDQLIKKAKKGDYKKADLDRAAQILEDHLKQPFQLTTEHNPLDEDKSSAVRVHLEAPDSVVLGEPVMVAVRVQNISPRAVWVSARINLYESDLRIFVTPPAGAVQAVQATAMMDSFPRMVELPPGAGIESYVGLVYTNVGFTFDREGVYRLEAEYDPGGTVELLHSNTVEMAVRPAVSAEEIELAEIMRDAALGRAIAIGNAGNDEPTIQKFKHLAERFPKHVAGCVACIVLSNTFSHEFRNLKSGDVLRTNDPAGAERFLDEALRQSDARQVARLACALLPPSSVRRDPTRQALLGRLERLASESDDDGSVAEAQKILHQSYLGGED